MKLINRVLLCCAFLLLQLAAQAQQGLRNNPQLQERIVQAKLLEIQKALNLSDAKTKELAPVYRRYQAELNELHFAMQEVRQSGGILRTNPDSLSAEDADLLISTQLDNAVKISTIRKKYYPELKAVLTPQQVLRLYQSEAQLRRRVMQELRKRMGNRFR